MENERQGYCVSWSGKMTEDQVDIMQDFFDAQARAEEEYTQDLSVKIKVSDKCARAISYGRTRSWWNEKCEQALIFLSDREQPIPMSAILRGEWAPFMAYEKAQEFIVGDRVRHVDRDDWAGEVTQITAEGDCVVKLDGKDWNAHFCPHNLIPV